MYASVKDEEIAKFSARTVDTIVKKGVNLGEIMQTAAEKYQGKGGGHDVAAGAQVPLENIHEFMRLVNGLVQKQLKGEKIEGSNHPEI